MARLRGPGFAGATDGPASKTGPRQQRGGKYIHKRVDNGAIIFGNKKDKQKMLHMTTNH